MLSPEEITEEQWRAAMSTYHKWIRKNPGMAWQAVCAEIMNRFHEQIVVAQLGAGKIIKDNKHE
jgi:hypothetical protein